MASLVLNLADGQDLPVDHDAVIKCSIYYFMREYSKNGSDFSCLLLRYEKLVNNLKNPPLEIFWFYVAVSFHCSSSNILKPRKRLLLVKNALNSLKKCSRQCNAVKKIALIAPILYLLCQLEINCSAGDPCLLEEIRSIVERLACYFSICCSQYLYGENEGLDNFWKHFTDLLRVWTIDRTTGACDPCVLATFFPILNNRFLEEIMKQPGYLTGAVMNETFLLRMCLRIPLGLGLNKEDLQRDMLGLAIQTIKGFQSFYFLDILFKTLLEGSLPVKALLCYTDAVLLQKVLYDAVVLIDYSFYFGRWSHSPENQPKKLALLWLLVADRAIRFAWSANEMVTAISYLNAFAESQIVTEIIKWAKLQAGIVDPINRLHIRTPQVLIEWLLILEEHGITIFDDESLALAKGVLSEPRIESCPLFIDLTSYAVDKGQEIGEALASNENDFNEGQVGYVSTSNEVDINEGLEIGNVLDSNELDVNEGRESADVFGSSEVYVQEGPEIGEPLSDDPSFANVEAESTKKRKTAFLNDVSDPQHKHPKHGDRPGSVTAGDDFIYLTSDDDMDEV